MVDINLIKRCQKNEHEAFELLFKLIANQALRTAFLVCGRRDIAEDIVQEALFECYKDIKYLRKPELFDVWFHRLLVRICWRMSSKTRKNSCNRLEDSFLDSFSVDISSEIEGKFINKAIQEAVNKLSDPLRTVIVLFYYNDMHIKDIAKVLECFEGTVKSRLHCARKVLRKELIKSGIEFREDNDFIWKEGLKRESKGTV